MLAGGARRRPRGVGRATLGWSEGAVPGFPGRTSFSQAALFHSPPGWAWYVPASSQAGPSAHPGAAALPPSWCLRLRQSRSPALGGPEQGAFLRECLKAVHYPFLTPAREHGWTPGRPGRRGGRSSRRRPGAGGTIPTGRGAGSRWAVPPGGGVRNGLARSPGRGGEGGAWGGRNHRGGVGR